MRDRVIELQLACLLPMGLTIHQVVKPAGARRTQRTFGFAERGAVQCSARRSGECSGFKTSELQLARRITRLRMRGLGFAAENKVRIRTLFSAAKGVLEANAANPRLVPNSGRLEVEAETRDES
jgi:hypothetical protein